MCWHGELRDAHSPAALRPQEERWGRCWPQLQHMQQGHTLQQLQCPQTAETTPVIHVARGSLRTHALLFSIQAPERLPVCACGGKLKAPL